MKHFFRGTSDGVYFKNLSLAHLLLVAIAFFGAYLIYRYKDVLQEDRYSKIFKRTIGITLLSQQIILYGWYFFTGFSSIKESLPLYNCRIAIICTALALLTDKKTLKNISVYWGLYGAILALIIVEGDPFSFPHYTIVSFFVGHIFLLWGSLFILFVDNYQVNKRNLHDVLKLTTAYHFVLLIFDIMIKANYDYLIEPPIFKSIVMLMPQMLYSIIAIIIFDLLICIVYFILNTIGFSKKATEVCI